MKDSFDTLLPVLTLLLGAWLARWTKKSDVRSAMRVESADLLGELPSRLWTQGGDDDWLNLNAAIARLRIRLAMTGLPSAMVSAVAESAITFWYGVDQDPDDGTVTVRPINSRDWVELSELVSNWLSTHSAVRRRMIEREFRKRPIVAVEEWDGK